MVGDMPKKISDKPAAAMAAFTELKVNIRRPMMRDPEMIRRRIAVVIAEAPTAMAVETHQIRKTEAKKNNSLKSIISPKK